MRSLILSSCCEIRDPLLFWRIVETTRDLFWRIVETTRYLCSSPYTQKTGDAKNRTSPASEVDAFAGHVSMACFRTPATTLNATCGGTNCAGR